MPDGPAPTDKHDKKRAKAELKAAKKQARAKEKQAAVTLPPSGIPRGAPPPAPDSPAERSARAAEEKVRLERWRVLLGAVGALVALITLFLMLRRGCGDAA